MTTTLRRFCVALFVFALVIGVVSVSASLPTAFAQDTDAAITGDATTDGATTDGAPGSDATAGTGFEGLIDEQVPAPGADNTPEQATPAEGGGTNLQLNPLEDDPDALSLFKMQSVGGEPVNPDTEATGPIPTIETVLDPPGVQPSGTPRTFTVTYENKGDEKIVAARIWHQLLVATTFNATFEVTCEAGGGAVCPNVDPDPQYEHGIPDGPQEVSGTRQDYTTTFWAAVDMEVGAKLTFTIAVEAAVQEGACSNSSEVMFGGYARYSDVGFKMPENVDGVQLPGDIKASGSSVGMMSEIPICDDGFVTMTNKVASPGTDAKPLRVLSGDPRTFTVAWANNTMNVLQVPIKYSYYVPYTMHYSNVSWNCESNLGQLGGCPRWGRDTKFIEHKNPGEEPDLVFEGDVSLAPNEVLTFTIVVNTTLNRCTQDGVLRVQTYAGRGAATEETGTFRYQAPSKLVEIGCASWIVQEDFTGTSVRDGHWIAADDACLTASTTSAGPGKLGECKRRRHLPPTDFYKTVGGTDVPAGYLALNEDWGGASDSASRKGSVLYDRPLPTKNGIVVEFDQYQYGSNLQSYSGDGIGFFLVDGSYPLNKPGPSGGSLGYASKPKDGVFGAQPGVGHGYLGVGFDRLGNFSHSSNRVAPHCGISGGHVAIQNSVTLRGPGDGFQGYCPIGKSAELDWNTQSLRYYGGIAGPLYWNDRPLAGHLPKAKRHTRVTVYPFRELTQGQRVTVEMDFGRGLETVLDRHYEGEIPASFKFGFSASTGLWSDAHMIGNVRVGTVLPLEPLDLTKSVLHADDSDKQYEVGEEVNYEFLISNISGETVTNVQVNDPLISEINCPASAVGPNDSLTCTGTLTVGERHANIGRLVNEATVSGFVDLDPRASSTSKAVAVIKPVAPDAERKVLPRDSTDFVLTKLSGEHADDEPLVKPNDPRKVTIEVLKPGANPDSDQWVAVPRTGAIEFEVPNQGTWKVQPGNLVTFTDAGKTRTITPLKYRVTSLYGGMAEGTLNIEVAEGLTNLRVEKLDQDGKPLDGSEFELFAEHADRKGKPADAPLDPGLVAVGTEPGVFRLDTVLTPGTYFLRETYAPPGYNLLAKDVELRYAEDGTLTVVGRVPQVQISELGDENQRGFVVKVTDRPGMKLPLSGGAGTWMLTLAGLGLLVLVIALSRRRSEKDK